MRTVGMLVYGEVEHDSRVRRAASALVGAGYDVLIGCLSASGDDAERELDGARLIPVGAGAAATLPGAASPFRGGGPGSRMGALTARVRWLIAYGRALRTWRSGLVARIPRADLWIGHDLFGLWAAAKLQDRDGGALIYDSHELFVEAGSAAALPGPARLVLARFERGLARRAAAVITVNDSIADELHRRYGVSPLVVLNVPGSWRRPVLDPFATTLGLAGRDVILYHGALSPGRGIEELVEVARTLPPDRVVVVLGDGPMRPSLSDLSVTPALAGRLIVHPAVPIDALPDWVGNAAVGVVAFQATTRNNVLGTPNKLFDYLVAGVPVVASDFPEMRRILREVDGGATCDPSDPAAIAAAIDQILKVPADVRAADRARLARVAGERYAWPAQAARLVGAVRAALAD